MVNISTQKIQDHLSNMLNEIISIFNENDINYFLVGGTLLGAIRHEGFIPWDDDIDLGMFRDDYNKLIEKWDEIAPNHLKLECKEKNKSFPYFYIKIYDKRTTLIENTKKNIVGGIFIDIFPFDKISEDQKKADKYMKKIKRLRSFYNIKTGYYNNNKDTFFIRYLIAPLIQIFLSEKAICKKIDKIINIDNSSNSKLRATFFGAWLTKDIYEYLWLSNTTYKNFNGIKCKVPIGYHDVLTKTYNNYMELPSEEKRKSHHNIKYLSLNESYLD